MRLLHYASGPVDYNPNRQYVQPEPIAGRKPAGLWVSVEGEDDWPSFLQRKNLMDKAVYVHEVLLASGAEIPHIRSSRELEQFHVAHAVEGEQGHRFWPIDWGRLSAQYDGIIIAPYLWSRRHDGPQWYYGWDAASGVIWNLRAVASFAPVPAGPVAGTSRFECEECREIDYRRPADPRRALCKKCLRARKDMTRDEEPE